jgi:hypothetical protein
MSSIQKIQAQPISKLTEEERSSFVESVINYKILAGLEFDETDKKQAIRISAQVNMMVKHFAHFSVQDIETAFEYAYIGKLDHFGVKDEMLITNPLRILNAYRQYVVDTRSDIKPVQEVPEEETKAADAKAATENIKAFWKLVQEKAEIETSGVHSFKYALMWDTLLAEGRVKNDGFEELEKTIYSQVIQKMLNPVFGLTGIKRQEICNDWDKGEIHAALEVEARASIKASKLQYYINEQHRILNSK